jgi:hypothetical protein
MPDVELRADFDHDGRFTGSPTEYAARVLEPGALLVANADADARVFPARVSAGPPVALDYQQKTKSGGDDEVINLQVQVVNAAAVADRRLSLRVSGIDPQRVRLYDGRGGVLPIGPGGESMIAPVGGQLDLRLEARAVPGSPFGRSMAMTTTFSPDDEEESTFLVKVVGRDAGGRETIFDVGTFSIAPVLFLDNLARAERLYVCDKAETQATLQDLSSALRGLGVELVTVPDEVAGPDAWLQDQFQPGLAFGADGWRHVIVHLPRMKADAVVRNADQNLRQFVLSHFPARNIAVVQDFWERTLSFHDVAGEQRTLSFSECLALGSLMTQVELFVRDLDTLLLSVDRTKEVPRPSSWTELRETLSLRFADLESTLEKAIAGVSPAWGAVLEGQRSGARKRLHAILKNMHLGYGTFRFVLGEKSFEIDGDLADELFERLTQLDSSANYGGNIECAPPTPDAPLGKIVIGNARTMTSAITWTPICADS